MSSSKPDVTVLIVDDQVAFRRAASAVLRRSEGFTLVGEAPDGAAAIAKVDELRPDLVLMDVRMPAMDGLAATRVIKASWPATRVVLCSTYDLADLPEQASSTGAVAYISKAELSPSVLEDTWRRIEEHLANHEPPPRTRS